MGSATLGWIPPSPPRWPKMQMSGSSSWALRRPARRPISYTQVEMLAQALLVSGRWTRHLPAALVVLSLAAVIVALARPVAPLPVPAVQNTVMLSIDVSRSMLADDLPPNRIEAAKAAAKEFVRILPRGLKVGLVTFSSYATATVPPTAERTPIPECVHR